MPQKTLYLHIGHYKTGTTALQTYFASKPALKRLTGLHYASTCRKHAKHSDLAFCLLRAAGAKHLMHGYNNPVQPEELWQKLFEEIGLSSAHQVLVSSEEFMRLALFPDAPARLGAILAKKPKGLSIKALVFLRPPGAQVRSWRKQLAKMRHRLPKWNDSLLKGAIEPIHYDYKLALGCWGDLLGPENLLIKAYRGSAAEPTLLIKEAMSALGLSYMDLFAPSFPADPNPSYTDLEAQIADLAQRARLTDRERDRLNVSVSEYQKTCAQESLWPSQTPEELEARIKAGVDWVAAHAESTCCAKHLATDLPNPVLPSIDALEDTLKFTTRYLLARWQAAEAHAHAQQTRLTALEARLEHLEAHFAQRAASEPS